MVSNPASRPVWEKGAQVRKNNVGGGVKSGFYFHMEGKKSPLLMTSTKEREERNFTRR